MSPALRTATHVNQKQKSFVQEDKRTEASKLNQMYGCVVVGPHPELQLVRECQEISSVSQSLLHRTILKGDSSVPTHIVNITLRTWHHDKSPSITCPHCRDHVANKAFLCAKMSAKPEILPLNRANQQTQEI